MEINRVYQFRTVYETESIRRAAQLLNLSPGALSKSIKVLEGEIGESLFVAKGRNIVPSEFAKTFYARSASLIQSYEDLVKKPHVPERLPLISIATWEVFSTYFIGHILESVFKGHRLRIIERTPHDLEKSILEGRADIGITYAPVPHRDLEICRVTQFRYGVYVLEGCFKNRDLHDLPFAAPITEFSRSANGVQSLDNWPNEVPRKVQYEFELLESALEACRRGNCAIFCPSFVVHLHNQSSRKKLIELRYHEVRDIYRDLYLITRRGAADSSIFNKMKKALKLMHRSNGDFETI